MQIHPKSFKSQTILQQLQALFPGSGVFFPQSSGGVLSEPNLLPSILGEFAKFLMAADLALFY
jgi:hypothetical protein